jgi:hypothetical protein
MLSLTLSLLTGLLHRGTAAVLRSIPLVYPVVGWRYNIPGCFLTKSCIRPLSSLTGLLHRGTAAVLRSIPLVYPAVGWRCNIPGRASRNAVFACSDLWRASSVGELRPYFALYHWSNQLSLGDAAIKPLAAVTSVPVNRMVLAIVFITFLLNQTPNLDGHLGAAAGAAIPETRVARIRV